MVYKINKFLKLASSFKFIIINIIFISFLFLYYEPALSKVTNIERDLALKYCDSIEKNLFKGLNNERILKYKYLFSSINIEEINDEVKSLNNFALEVKSICSYNLSNEEKENFRKELKYYISKD